MNALQQRLQGFSETLNILEQANEAYYNDALDQSGVGEHLFKPANIATLRRRVESLDQNSPAGKIEEIDDILGQGLERVNEILAEAVAIEDELAQSDPDAPKIGKMRKPEDDGVVGNDIERPYPHHISEMVEAFGPACGGVSSSNDKGIKFKDGTTIEFPKKSPGPQTVESGDNPDSYKKQNSEPTMTDEDIASMLDQAAGPALDRIARISEAQEERLVQSKVNDYLSQISDPAIRRGAEVHFKGAASLDDFDVLQQHFEEIAGTIAGPAKWKGIGANFNLNQMNDAPLRERAPRDNQENIQKLVQTIDDEYRLSDVITSTAADGTLVQRIDDSEFSAPQIAGRPMYYSPRQGLTNLLQTMTNIYPEAAQKWLMWEQGLMEQAAPTISLTDVASAQPFIFPIIARVYPQLLLTRVGAVYPMDRPLAQLFYWDDVGVFADGSEAGYLYDTEYLDWTLGDDNGEGEISDELELRIRSANVEVSSKKLHANWSLEVEQDLRAYHNRELINEVVTKMADQIARKINRTALSQMLTASNDREVTYGTLPPATGSWTADSWADQLHFHVQLASDEIFKKRYREGAIIIGDARSTSRLMRGMKSGLFQQSKDEWRFNNGIQVVGSVNNYFTVIKTPTWGLSAMSNTLLVVARGETFSDAGIVYAPYTYEVVPMLAYPDVATKKVGIMERSALKVIIPEMFARVSIQNTTGTNI